MYKDEATAALKPRCGNEHFIGYCVKLAKSVFEIVNRLEKVNFNYTICIAPDGKYGERFDEDGTWNGMVGELVRQVIPAPDVFNYSILRSFVFPKNMLIIFYLYFLYLLHVLFIIVLYDRG